MNNVSILGTGKYVPNNIVSNDDLSRIVDTSDEWIQKRTGIRKRRISKGEENHYMAKEAALNAMEDAGVLAEDINLIIVATSSPDNITPSTACIVQKEIGAKNAFAFDVSAGCSGFIYALDIASQFIRNGTCKNALVIGSEVLSRIVNWKDRGTCVLFGDGAGAVILKSSEEDGIPYSVLGSIGENWDKLKCKYKPINNPFIKDEILIEDEQEYFVTMDGKEIFKFALEVMTNSINTIKEREQINDINLIKYIIPHQANKRIIEGAAKKLNIELDKFYINLDEYGNTSSASIPIALDELNKNKLIKKGDKLIFIAFGSGLTYGYSLINWIKN